MEIKQELLDSGFIVRVKTEAAMLSIVNYFGLDVGSYDYQYGYKTCLDYDEGTLEYADIEWYESNHPYGNNILEYEDIWANKTVKMVLNEIKHKNTKESIISLILDKQLSSGKRFDKFIDDLPVDNDMLIDFIFEDGDLLLQEVFEILSYLNCEINIEEENNER